MHRLALLALLLLSGSTATSTECEQCKFAVELLHDAWGDKTTEECVGELALFICQTFKIEDHFICKGIVSDFSDEFMYVLGQIIVEPHQICGLFFDDCGKFIDPFNSTWSVPMPAGQPAPVDKQPVPAGKPTLRALHLTDIHLDMYYTPGLETKCSEPQCCRPQQDPNEVSVAASADVQVPAGPWGMVGDCDTPYWLFINMLGFIQKNHKDLDYVMVSGDLVSHAVWDYTRDAHVAMIRNISDTIRMYFPNIPTYFAVGNHEGVPIDNFAPHFTPKQFHMDWLYDTMADSWNEWIPEDQVKTVKYMGCYMKQIYPGLRLISVNNALGGDSVNFFLYVNQTDPDGTLSWLIKQLQDAELAGDRVHILAHIPGGNGEALEGWALNYYNVVNRFQNTIVGQFFGHTHSEEFYVTYENPESASSRPTSVVYSAPSVTTYSQYFPAYRIYTIDGAYQNSSYQVIDFEEWYFNITEANANPANPQWKQLYASVNQEYGLKSQAPSEWNNMIERMKTDDVLFEKYRENYYRRSRYDGIGGCGEACKKGWLCSARQLHHSKALCADLDSYLERNGRNSYHRKPKPAQLTKSEINQALLARKHVRANDQCPL
ncbi:Sphingomyelin phosphodiesterase [Trichostrongylus colubriformis]|uniref:Sphingomyelin phosphodiesterase n=1 Tax=Trichostrongylus colubriformis TaxID=6319 RepID=A0AAN8G8D1_TRICO